MLADKLLSKMGSCIRLQAVASQTTGGEAHVPNDLQVWSEAINVMLLTHAKWRTFTSRPIPPKTSSEVMLAVSCDSREAVDAMNETASANGGTADINPPQDLGFMHNRNLADPDGHVWEAMWMDPAAIPE